MKNLKLLTALAGLTLASAAQAQAPVKVFIMAGQSNMQGRGWYDDRSDNGIDELGTLQKFIDNDPGGAYDYLQSSPGVYNTRSDVNIYTTDGARSGGLTVGYGVDSTFFGPELGFGWQVGDAYTEDVLIIKANWGGKSLQNDFRPPSAVRERGGEVGFYYNQILTEVNNVLGSIGTYVPGYAGQGYELQGFAWHQGFNDRVSAVATAEYAQNIDNFIHDIRFDLGASDLPFVIANTGIGGPGETDPTALALMDAQLTVDELTGSNPIFNVRAIDTRQYWRDPSISPITGGGQGFHWNQNGETMFLMGDGIGAEMTTLSDYNVRQDAYVQVNQQTGEIKLINSTGTFAADFDLEAYQITSASGALDPTAWASVAGNYDAAGDGSVDDGDWTIGAGTNFALGESADVGGDDGSIMLGNELSLGVGAWVQNLSRDLNATFTDLDGNIHQLYIQYTGNNNILADLNFDGSIDIDDWGIFVTNGQADISGLSTAFAYQIGDLDGDLDSDVDDFLLFRQAFDLANPEPGAFETMLTAYAVPEPSSLAMLGLSTLALLRRRGMSDRY